VLRKLFYLLLSLFLAAISFILLLWGTTNSLQGSFFYAWVDFFFGMLIGIYALVCWFEGLDD